MKTELLESGNGLGWGSGGINATVTDQHGKKVGESIKLASGGPSKKAAENASATAAFASQAIASSMTAVSSSVETALTTLGALSSSVSTLAAKSAGPATDNANGKGLLKFATATATSTASGTSSGTSGTAGTTQTASSTMNATLQAGSDATVVDFGTLTINGVRNHLGSVQAPYMTTAQARQYVADAINSNTKNNVTASVNEDGTLALTSKDGGAIDIQVGRRTTEEPSQYVGTGFESGTYGNTVSAAGAITSPLFAENFEAAFASAMLSGNSTSGTGTTSSTTPIIGKTPPGHAHRKHDD